MSKTPSFQDLILRLHAFWAAQGCVILQPYDVEMGAGTFHPATTLRALGGSIISKKTGLAAISKVLTENPKQWTNPFPIPNPVTGNVKPWIGKWVALPRVSESEFITDTGKSYLVAGY